MSRWVSHGLGRGCRDIPVDFVLNFCWVSRRVPENVNIFVGLLSEGNL